ncbi:MAG: C4-dicarboxylate ABC transporter, partial [Burkholderiales bacterium]
GDVRGRELAQKAGNSIVALDMAETQRWKRTAASVESDWVKEMQGKGIDGARLLAEAKALIAQYEKK